MKRKENDRPDAAEPMSEQEIPEVNEAALEGEVAESVGDQPQSDEGEAGIAEWQAALELAVKQRDELKDSLLQSGSFPHLCTAD